MKLIPTTNLNDWDTADTVSEWLSDNNGSVVQNILVGTTKNGSGTRLIYRKTKITDEGYLNLLCIIGTTYQTGLVFNYIDEDNYAVVLTDRKSSGNDSWDTAVGLMVKGSFKYLCKESFTSIPPTDVSFEVKSNKDNLDILVNGKVLYIWPSQNLVNGTSYGLYSQKNNDANFRELIVSNALVLSQPNDSTVQPQEGSIETGNIDNRLLMGNEHIESKLESYLKVKDPAAESVIEFKRSYRVSLDSLYSSIYLNSELKRPREEVGNKKTQAVALDYRPKRWYREYHNILEAIQLCLNDVKRADTTLLALENNGAYPEDVDVVSHNENIQKARSNYFIAQDKLEQFINEKNELEREMRLAGYMVRTENVPTEFELLGYNFYIVSGIAGYADFDPIDYDPNADFKQDSEWKSTEEVLKEKLFNNLRFSESSQVRYSEKVALLESNSSYLHIIKPDLDKIVSEIGTLDSQIKICQSEIEQYNNEILDWQADKDFLLAQSVKFREYVGSEYPVTGAGVGPSNNQLFKNFLINTGKNNLKVLRYQENVSGNNYSVHINQYGGLEYYHDYKIITQSRHVYETYQVWIDVPWHDMTKNDHWETRVLHDYWTTDYFYNFVGDQNVRNFFNQGIQICDYYMGTVLPNEIATKERRLVTLQNTKIGLNYQKIDIETNGLKLARENFLDEWNRTDD